MSNVNVSFSEKNSSHVLYSLLSKRGHRMHFPTGIVWQAEQAASAKIKATTGMALSSGRPIMLENTQKMLPAFSSTESVAYAPVAGIPPLRHAWRTHIKKRNPSLKSDTTTLPIVTSGLTHGISLLLGLVLGPDEELIVPAPFWENYEHIASTFLGGRLKNFPMFANMSSPSFNVEGLRTAIAESAQKQGKALILLNFPNNPTGYSISERCVHDIQTTLLSFAEKGVPLLVLCDDAYFGLFYEKETYKESLFSALSSLHENLLAAKIDGATKELFAWGLRVGFLTFGCKKMSSDIEKTIEGKIKGALRSSTTSGCRLSQSIVLRMLEDKILYDLLLHQKKLLAQRYRALVRELPLAVQKYPESGLSPYPFNSGYFMSFHCGRVDAETLRTFLLENEGLGLIAIGDLLRLTFSAIDDAELTHIVHTLYKSAQSLSS